MEPTLLTPGMVISINVRQLREKAKLTMKQLAALMDAYGFGWTVDTVRDVERPALNIAREREPGRVRKLSPDELVALSFLFQVTAIELFRPGADNEVEIIPGLGVDSLYFMATVFLAAPATPDQLRDAWAKKQVDLGYLPDGASRKTQQEVLPLADEASELVKKGWGKKHGEHS